MRSFGFALVTVLCAVQLTVALPRPDYGIAIDVFSADKTGAIALEGIALLNELWSTEPIEFTSGYATLPTVLTEIENIGNGFVEAVRTLLQALSDLTEATSDVQTSFGAVTDAIMNVLMSFGSDLGASKNAIDAALPDNHITLMLDDAFGKALGPIMELLSMGVIEDQINAAVADAGSESAVTNVILRKRLSIHYTSQVTVGARNVNAELPLMFYILGKVKELLVLADQYIVESGDVAQSAVDYVNEGLAALVDEVQSYSSASSDITAIIDDVSTPNLDFSGVNLPAVPDVAIELDHITTTYTDHLDNAISNIIEHYDDYKSSIPAVSDGYAEFLAEEACDQIYTVVTTLINNGPYAEYCFYKYGEDALVIYDTNAREANECVDKEMTRLIKLQEVLVSIAEQIAFSVEDLLETVTTCYENSDACNNSDIDEYLSNLHSAIDEHHLYVLEAVVEAETDAGLSRLQACFAANKYNILNYMWYIEQAVQDCEENGPEPAFTP